MSKKLILTILIAIVVIPGAAYGINIVAEGFRVSTANKTVDAWGMCRVATAQTSGVDYFVPTKTLSEWQSVIDNKPSDLFISACPPPVNAACGTGSGAACSIGTLDMGSIYEDCIDSRCAYMRAYWTCLGSNGGANASCQGEPYFSCLTADTLITMENGTKKPISTLVAGDRVVGKNSINTITVARNFTTYEYVYGINGSKAFVTGGHPFLTKGGWKAISPDKTPDSVKKEINPGKLVIGDYILLETGKYTKVETITPSDNPTGTVVYNPGVDGDNTYYANGMLVHNK